MLKKIIPAALLLTLPVAANAQAVVEVFRNKGQCNSYWSHMDRKLWTHFGCAKRGNVWVLVYLG